MRQQRRCIVGQRRHDANRQRLVSNGLAHGVQRDILGRQQGDIYRAVQRVVDQIEKRVWLAGRGQLERHGLVEAQVDLWCGRAGGRRLSQARLAYGVELKRQLRVPRTVGVDGPLVVDLPFDRQHGQAVACQKTDVACHDRNAGLQRQRLDGTAFVADRHDALGGRSGLQWNAKQLQEFQPVALRNAVGTVEQRIGQEREQLHQRNARVALDVEVCPLRRVRGNATLGIVQQLLVVAIVQDGQFQWHGVSPPIAG